MTAITSITEMLATRLCHDLTGPIGAVNNGAELMEEDPSMQADAMELIAASAEEAGHRIQFYRQAYGRIAKSGEANLAEKKTIIENFYKMSKVSLVWGNDGAMLPAISHAMARILVNMVLIAGATLIKGGKLHTYIIEGEEFKGTIEVKAEGEVVKLDEEMLQALNGQLHESELSPKTVQPYLMLEMVKSIGGVFEWDLQPEFLTLTVKS